MNGGDSLNQLIALDRTKKSDPRRENHRLLSYHLLDDIVNAAMRRLQSYHYSEIRRLQCEFYDGILILRGRVSSYFLKQLAQEAVRSVVGVTRIINRLEVVPAAVEDGATNWQDL